MSFIQNFFTSRDNNANAATYVGQQDRLWYNPITQTLYVSDGSTPGGIPLNLATGANITANVITVNTITSTSGTVTVSGELEITGNISPASENKIGGIYPGPGVVISTGGELTIDTANLPLSFGNFTASNNILSIVNADEDMILATEGNAEIQLVGNIGFYRDSIPPAANDIYFSATNDGQVEIYAVTPDNLNGAVKITGNQDGITQTPVVAGVLLQLTGQPNIGSRIYNDSNNDRGLFVGRRYNGTESAPTQVLDNQEILRIAATGYPGNAWPSTGSAQIRFIAEGDQTSTNQGGRIEFTTVPVGNTNVTTILTVNAANGASATKFTTSGTISATGNITTANTFAGNVTGLLTRSVRDAGTIADGGTLTVNITTDDIVYCTWNNGMTLAYSNFAPGRVVKVIATKGTGSGSDALNLDGVTASHTSTGSTTINATADTSTILDLISTTSNVAGLYIKV